MGFKDSLVKIVGLGEIEDDEFVTEEELQAVSRREEKREERRAAREARREQRRSDDMDATFVSRSSEERYHASNPRTYGEEAVSRSSRAMENRLSMQGKGSNSLKLILIEPKSFDECSKLVDSLKARKPIIINLENLEREIAKKIFDFLNGATYALNGNVQKITNNIFIFTPDNVSVDQEETPVFASEGDSFNRWG